MPALQMSCASPSSRRRHSALRINALLAANCNLHPFRATIPDTLSCLKVRFRTGVVLINANEHLPDFTEVHKNRSRTK